MQKNNLFVLVGLVGVFAAIGCDSQPAGSSPGGAGGKSDTGGGGATVEPLGGGGVSGGNAPNGGGGEGGSPALGGGGSADGGSGGQGGGVACLDDSGTPNACTLAGCDPDLEVDSCQHLDKLKNGVRAAAVECLNVLPEDCNQDDDEQCFIAALALACSDPSADAYCADYVTHYAVDPNDVTWNADCHAAIDGLTISARDLVGNYVELWEGSMSVKDIVTSILVWGGPI